MHLPKLCQSSFTCVFSAFVYAGANDDPASYERVSGSSDGGEHSGAKINSSYSIHVKAERGPNLRHHG